MRQICFSHSYRDRATNEYILSLFTGFDVKLVADQKAKTYCVPKLERYVFGSGGFVAVVPQRETGDPSRPYSEYIEQEINLARRARTPRLIFVEDAILSKFRARIPIAEGDFVPFQRTAPRSDENEHRQTVERFCAKLEAATTGSTTGQHELRKVAVAGADTSGSAELSDELDKLLETHSYCPRHIPTADLARLLDDPTTIEALYSAEFCVFCLEPRLSEVHLGLATANALCRPAFRLVHDPGKATDEPLVNGVLPWGSVKQLSKVFDSQLHSYRRGFLEAMAGEIETRGFVDRVANDWSPTEPEMLVNFVSVGDQFLRQYQYSIVDRFGSGFSDLVAEGRKEDLCRAAYEEMRRYEWLYDFEPGSPDYTRQVIRTPAEILADRRATCLDLACLFAALLETMGADPVILRVTGRDAAHALAGCWLTNPPVDIVIRDQQRVRSALTRGDLLLFETTGVARTAHSVGGEPQRSTGFLTFDEARKTAHDLVVQGTMRVDFLLDVQAAR